MEENAVSYEKLFNNNLVSHIIRDGYFIITNLPQDIQRHISELLKEGGEFFEKPKEYKELHTPMEMGFDVGYSHTPNVKEAFQVRLSNDPLIPWQHERFQSTMER
jgi:isopenicillin N synthase-like dioxygenase